MGVDKHKVDFESRLRLVLEHEILSRDHNKVNRLKKQAKLRLTASASQLDYRAERGLKKIQMAELLNGAYLQKRQNLLIILLHRFSIKLK